MFTFLKTKDETAIRHLNGHCLCRAISFSVPAPRAFDVCHCDDCRRWHGASPVGIDATIVTMTSGLDQLTWFRSSPGAERGFCKTCGTSLFYRYTSNPSRWSAYAGALVDIPPEIPLGNQHFTHHKPTCYAVVRGR